MLEAEVLDAVFVEDEEEPAFVKESAVSVTLVDQLKNPKVAAVLLTILIALLVGIGMLAINFNHLLLTIYVMATRWNTPSSTANWK